MKHLQIIIGIGLIVVMGGLSGVTASAFDLAPSSKQPSDLTVVFGVPEEFGSNGTVPVELNSSSSDPEEPGDLIGEPASELSLQENLDSESLVGETPVLKPESLLSQSGAELPSESMAGNTVPEPSTLFLLALGMLGITALCKRTKNRTKA